jgi:hypothetical protein
VPSDNDCVDNSVLSTIRDPSIYHLQVWRIHGLTVQSVIIHKVHTIPVLHKHITEPTRSPIYSGAAMFRYVFGKAPNLYISPCPPIWPQITWFILKDRYGLNLV